MDVLVLKQPPFLALKDDISITKRLECRNDAERRGRKAT